MRVDLCATGDVAQGEVLKVETDGLVVAVFNVDGVFYVTDDHCTHGPGSLSEGFLEGFEIECDFHQGCFDVRTGEITAPPPMVPITTYPVVMKGDRVTIEADPIWDREVAITVELAAPAPDDLSHLRALGSTITIEGNGAFACAETDTLLRAALRSGLGFPYTCNTGSCGDCRFALMEGAVEHVRRDAPAWTDRDRKRGRWLGCQAQALDDCTIKVRLDPEMVPLHRPTRMTGRLTEIVEVTHDIGEFAFALDGPDAFLPGQYALIELVGVRGGRPYSMANLPGDGEWRFQVKRVPGGEVTSILFDELRPGDSVGIDGPYGHAYLREDQPRDLLLVAGGSGLSPMVSIARAAAASAALSGRAIHFLYGGRQPRDICGEPMLMELPGYGDRLTYLAAISEQSDGWHGPTGFIHEVVQEAFGDRLDNLEIYFAGPSAMAQAMQSMLHEAGVSSEHTHFDEFY